MPARIDFYLLESPDDADRWLLACRLLEKAYATGHRVYAYCNNQQDAEHLDELLWTFKKESFIPHHLQGEGPEPPPPIQIGFQEPSHGFNDILLNLSLDIPTFYRQFKRVMELVVNEETEKEKSRARYREYRVQGCVLHIHPIK